LARLLHATTGKQVFERFSENSNASYAVNGDLGIFIKYSSKRMSPWRFTFRAEHLVEIERLRFNHKVFAILVCNDDGIVCLNYEELKTLVYNDNLEGGWISASRSARKKYGINGTNGTLKTKVGANDFPSKMFLSSTC
jgi:hypothetical protein